MASYDDAAEVLGELRRREVLVAVCSNWFWDIETAIDQAGLTGLIDIAVTSARAGARKPHPLIFHRTLAECGLQPREALFVGDSWQADVEGALAVGIPALHLCRPDNSQALAAPRRVPRVCSLREVLDVVAREVRI
jgi:putative hydrolase of the HAD superfamily